MEARDPALEPPGRLACAWCGFILREGVGAVSHGICDPCFQVLVASIERKKDGAR